MTRTIGMILAAALLLVPVSFRMAGMMKSRPLEERLGFLPSSEFLKVAALNHKSAISEWIFLRALTYYGTKFDRFHPDLAASTDYYGIYRFLYASTFLDPYNIDAYYFAQAILTWGLGRIPEANNLLERGLAYRKWDFYLPFFLGFNHFYFLKNNKEGARYFKIAAEMTGDAMFTTLAARLMYEANDTQSGISFLKFMLKGSRSRGVNQSLVIRLKALEAAAYLEDGLKRYMQGHTQRPAGVDELLKAGSIDKIPQDPYGGTFYIDNKGKIRSTSNLAFGARDGLRDKDR